MRKFPDFYLAVPDFLLTFANAYKTIVNYPAGRPLSPMASSRRLFFMPNGEKHFS